MRREADGHGVPEPIVASLASLADKFWTEFTEAADERIGLIETEHYQVLASERATGRVFTIQ